MRLNALQYVASELEAFIPAIPEKPPVYDSHELLRCGSGYVKICSIHTFYRHS